VYRPLPLALTIKKSKIEGLGLFAREDIKKNHEFGISHVLDEKFEDGYIRTPLGGFFNHCNIPNCEAYKEGEYIKLRAIKDIKKGDEITVRYWLYNIK
jgi:SET domain-containing protein